MRRLLQCSEHTTRTESESDYDAWKKNDQHQHFTLKVPPTAAHPVQQCLRQVSRLLRKGSRPSIWTSSASRTRIGEVTRGDMVELSIPCEVFLTPRMLASQGDIDDERRKRADRVGSKTG